MYKNVVFWLLLISFILSSCTNPSPAPFSLTPGNVDEYLAPTHTPRPIPTPFPKSENGEIALILRKRAAPFEAVILRLPSTCLLGGEFCKVDGNLLGALPQSLSQVLKIYWTNDGNRAFFWDDNAGDIYVLNGNEGVFTVFKKEIWKVRGDILVSPDGEHIMFETQKGDYETDLVMMNSSSGDMVTFDIPVPGTKYASQWLDDTTVLCWSEVSEGKGYLVDLKVFMLNTSDHSVQPFDVGSDWMQTSIPIFSPDKKLMVFTANNKTIIRDASSSVESVWDVTSEKSLWSADSGPLALYDTNRKIYIAYPNEGRLQEVHSLSSSENLEDWIWLPDSQHILLVVVDSDGNRQLGILSVDEKTFAPINLSLLNEYDPVSFSFRP